MPKGMAPKRTKQFRMTSPVRPGLDKGGVVQNVRTRGKNSAEKANYLRAFVKGKLPKTTK